MTIRITTNRLLIALTVGAIALTGCSSTDSSSTSTSGTDTSSAGSSTSAASSSTGSGSTATAAEAVTLDDAWVKAADAGMSAAFGVLSNSSDADVTVTAAASPASTMLELHQTVTNDAGEMVMTPVEGGFVVPAGGTLALEPGGNHIMLMDLTGPLVAGDEVPVTLTFADGSTAEFTAPVKDYSGANESYEGDSGMTMDSGS
ncbi:copper chaperone PCu(A)C [Millisia brevis]|uniref:copper chaperone PCu(A)C n=1 Tax=Millisia brevis TaxID=264148 RepID=UPI0009FCF871|nr:copper chaperone PCu(A)C [Millisia brevis]